MNTFTIPEGTKKVKIDQIDNKVIIEFIPQVEKFEPKDGDIIVNNYPTIAIYNSISDNNAVKYYAALISDSLKIKNNPDIGIGYIKSYRFATDSEKQLLFDKLAERGFKWNDEEKKIEKLRWRAKKGEMYWTFTNLNGVVKEDEDNMGVDDRAYYNGAYFQHKEQAQNALEAVKNLLLNTEW